jgi:hypothetical protein
VHFNEQGVYTYRSRRASKRSSESPFPRGLSFTRPWELKAMSDIQYHRVAEVRQATNSLKINHQVIVAK